MGLPSSKLTELVTLIYGLTLLLMLLFLKHGGLVRGIGLRIGMLLDELEWLHTQVTRFGIASTMVATISEISFLVK